MAPALGLQPDFGTPGHDKPALVLAPGIESAQRYYADIPSSWLAAQNDKAAGTAATPQRDGSTEMQTRRSYAIPAAEILGFQSC